MGGGVRINDVLRTRASSTGVGDAGHTTRPVPQSVLETLSYQVINTSLSIAHE